MATNLSLNHCFRVMKKMSVINTKQMVLMLIYAIYLIYSNFYTEHHTKPEK